MAEFPALPLWTDAYLGDTSHLNVTEHGAYLLLLITAWRSADCALPDDDRLLARYARCDARQWKKLRPILAPFFTIENGKWRQGRLTDELQALLDKREKAAANGRASALKRKGRHSAKRKQRDSGANAEREQSENLTNNHSHNHDSEDKSSADLQAFDAETVMWRHGRLYLASQGVSPDKAGSLLGKWKKAHGAEAVIVALGKAQREGAIDAVSFIEGCFRQRRRDDYDPDRITV